MTLHRILQTLALILAATTAQAQCPSPVSFVDLPFAAEGKASTALGLCVGQVATVVAKGQIGTVIVGDPGIVAANVLTSGRLTLTALRQGETSVVLLAPDAKTGATLELAVQPAPQGQAIQQPPQQLAEPAGKRSILIYRGAEWELIECETDCVKR